MIELKRLYLSLVASITVLVGLFFLFADNQHTMAEEPSRPSVLGQHTANLEETTSLIPEEERYKYWQRPGGPLRVGLQAGHWQNQELPDEFHNLRAYGGGTKGGGKAEWEVNLAIAERTKEYLETTGVIVDILPATIPRDYWADAIVSIHADGSESRYASGYKVAPPRHDLSGRAGELSNMIEASYGKHSKLRLDQNITDNMREYYGFNWKKYEHAIHPMAPAAILETGFLTNWSDATILIKNPEIPARGLAEGIISFLRAENDKGDVSTSIIRE